MSEILQQLQTEVGEWSKVNYPEQVAWQCLMGAVEEIGELCHAHLKETQKIRATAAEHQANAKDSIGDAVIYLAQFCNHATVELGENFSLRSMFLLGMYNSVGIYHHQKELETWQLLFKCVEYLGQVCREFEGSVFYAPHEINASGILSASNRLRTALGFVLSGLATYCEARQWDFQDVVQDTWNRVKQRTRESWPQDQPVDPLRQLKERLAQVAAVSYVSASAAIDNAMRAFGGSPEFYERQGITYHKCLDEGCELQPVIHYHPDDLGSA